MRPRGPRDWHPEDIKAAVRKTRYGSLRALGEAFALPRHACSNALREPHCGGELAIAAALGLTPREIWPSRFHLDGSRRHPPRRLWKSNAPARAGHCESREAS